MQYNLCSAYFWAGNWNFHISPPTERHFSPPVSVSLLTQAIARSHLKRCHLGNYFQFTFKFLHFPISCVSNSSACSRHPFTPSTVDFSLLPFIQLWDASIGEMKTPWHSAKRPWKAPRQPRAIEWQNVINLLEPERGRAKLSMSRW